MLHTFVVLDPSLTDRLALLEGKDPVPELRLEVCACFATAAYRIFVSGELDQRTAGGLVGVASRHAIAPEEFPAQLVSRYMAGQTPVRDLATRMAGGLG